MASVHIVDDNFTVRESIEFILEEAGYAVRGYASSEDFLNQVDGADETGCAIVDLHMPRMSGLDLLGRIKEMGVALPMIMMTGDGCMESVVKAMRCGAAEFMTKPFNSATLLATVHSAIEGSGARSHESCEAYFCRERRATLLPGEEAVLAGMLQGQSIEAIASELGLFAHAVRSRHSTVMTKMGAKNLPDLVRKSLLADTVPLV